VEFAPIFTSLGERKFRLGSVSANENMPSELDSGSWHGVCELSERSGAKKRAKARASRMCPNKRISTCDPMAGRVCRLSALRHTGCTRALELPREHKPSPPRTSAGSHHRHSIEVLIERAARRLAIKRSSGRAVERSILGDVSRETSVRAMLPQQARATLPNQDRTHRQPNYLRCSSEITTIYTPNAWGTRGNRLPLSSHFSSTRPATTSRNRIVHRPTRRWWHH
jgi:hypothetical protein